MDAIIKSLFDEINQTTLKEDIIEEFGPNLSDEDFKKYLDEITPTDVLSADLLLVYRVMLAFGGPTRFIDISYNREGQAVKAVYFDSSCKAINEYTLSPANLSIIADRYHWLGEEVNALMQPR